MTYKVMLLPRSQKDLDSFNGKEFSKLIKIITNLSTNPRLVGSLKLTGEEGYRIRAGDIRILYRVDDKIKVVYVYRVRHRM